MQESVVLTLNGILLPEQQWQYIYLPFEVPEHIGRIDISYSYESATGSEPQLTGGNTIDIGIFDTRGYEAHSPGYRGWSGSARQHFFISQNAATPGYMPGAIQAGTWYIILGLYKIAPEGCPYQVNIRLTRTENSHDKFPALLRLSEKPGKRVRADGWYKGELHCHTVHSDGDSSPEQIVELAESLGLDFLAITDHNNRSQGITLANCETELILIPGYEVTTYYGHWNIWGDNGWIDFRVQSPEDMAQYIAEASARGYLVSCNHPRPFGPDWAFREVAGFQCVEVWNGPWQLLNSHCLSFWEEKLRQGQRLTAVGGSDHHFTWREHIARMGQPTTYIYSAEAPSSAGLLRALRAGHAFISESPTGARLDFRAGDAMMGDSLLLPDTGMLEIQVNVIDGAGGRLQLMGMEGLLAQADISDDDVHLKLSVNVSGMRYIRVQLIDPGDESIRALTNPIYLCP